MVGLNMKKVFLILLVSILFSSAAMAETFENFASSMTYFYKNPTEKEFTKFQKSADHFSPRLVGSKKGTDIFIAVMIAKIFEKNHWPILDTVYTARVNEILRGQSKLAKFVADDALVNPLKLDLWWASFFATGDERYLENIYQFAGLELPKSNVRKLLVIGAATWSFKSNCRQHERVQSFAKKKLGRETGAKLELVKTCVANAVPTGS